MFSRLLIRHLLVLLVAWLFCIDLQCTRLEAAPSQPETKGAPEVESSSSLSAAKGHGSGQQEQAQSQHQSKSQVATNLQQSSSVTYSLQADGSDDTTPSGSKEKQQTPSLISIADKIGHQSDKQANTRPSTATVEKLKRGLTSFMNQLNPAPFFVPATSGGQQVGSITSGGLNGSGVGVQQAELAAIVNDADPSGEVLVKRPLRVAQTRPIGGPLRWGRRRR